MIMKLQALLLALTLTGLACSSYGSEPLPLAITIQADKLETAPGDSVSFQFTAQGGRLELLRVTWGDGSTFEESALSARTMTRRVKYAYSAAGMYEVTAYINDAFAGQKTATQSIRIR